MSEPKLESSIRDLFAPLLRAEGFAGSGRNYRRLTQDWIQVVNVQGSGWGGQFAVNLATHPVSLPDPQGNEPDPKRIRACQCEFRCRLHESGTDQWWHYDASRPSMDAAVSSASGVFADHGRPFFHPQKGVRAKLLALRVDDLVSGAYHELQLSTTNIRMAFALARYWFYKSRLVEAAAFANYALSNLGRGVNLRSELLRILEMSQHK